MILIIDYKDFERKVKGYEKELKELRILHRSYISSFIGSPFDLDILPLPPDCYFDGCSKCIQFEKIDDIEQNIFDLEQKRDELYFDRVGKLERNLKRYDDKFNSYNFIRNNKDLLIEALVVRSKSDRIKKRLRHIVSTTIPTLTLKVLEYKCLYLEAVKCVGMNSMYLPPRPKLPRYPREYNKKRDRLRARNNGATQKNEKYKNNIKNK